MYDHHRVLLFIGFLLLGFPSDWEVLADECIDLTVHAARIAICCQHEAMFSPETFKSCFKTTDPEKDINSVVCDFDCAYRDMGFLQGEDEINAENITMFQAVYDDAYQEAIGNAVNHCVAIKDSFRQKAELVQTKCSSFAVHYHACVVMQVTLNCPVERWNDSSICEKLKGGTPLCKM